MRMINSKGNRMKIYYSPGACSMATHIVAREAGHAFDLQKVDIPSKTIDGGGDYWEINPKGYVPALMLDDGEVERRVRLIRPMEHPTIPLAMMPQTHWREVDRSIFARGALKAATWLIRQPAGRYGMDQVLGF